MFYFHKLLQGCCLYALPDETAVLVAYALPDETRVLVAHMLFLTNYNRSGL